MFCLARDLDDLQTRLARIVVAQRRDGSYVTSADLKAVGAMAVLLRDALMPNLVQTLEGSPALVHGGPFANIAHGCNSLIATRLAMKLADVVVTEAGFGADLGAEKFLDIKCRAGGIWPGCAVVVATVRALKMHGGVAKADLGREDVAAVTAGVANLARHVENMGKFGLPVVVAINRFDQDSDAEIGAVADGDLAPRRRGDSLHPLGRGRCRRRGVGASRPGAPAGGVAKAGAALPAGAAARRKDPRHRAARSTGPSDISLAVGVARRLEGFERAGFGALPVCIAKTQYSFSADPEARGAPTGHVLPVREARLAAGAGFVVAICGDIMTMPGLPRTPAAEAIHLTADGAIDGLF